MSIYHNLIGLVRVQLTSANIASTLSALNQQNISITEICRIDDVTSSFTISRNDLKAVKMLTEKRGEHIVIIRRSGLFWPLHALLRRPVLIAGLVLLLMLGVMLPGRILFISVEGNERIPDQLILESAERCGIRFGADRRKVKSEKVKNMLLGELQDLKWAGVNTYGCRAVVTVREKERVVSEKPMPPVSHIVAARDGIITSRTAIRGTNMCQPGQAVKSGDILISGYTDCGITIISGRAEGEIMAQTKRDLTAVTPSVSRFREQHFKNEVRYSVLIGKNRINFFKGSGISGGSCVKMSMKYVLTLPGGFTLPISVIKETVTECALSGQPGSDLSQLLRVFTEDYLKNQMVAGSIIHKAEQIHESDGLVMLTGSYTCSEDIGIVQEEKIGEHNGKADGTDRERGSGG